MNSRFLHMVALVQAGVSAASRLVKVLSLPEEDDSHMPPSGKPQPSAEDLALIRWWIDAGASATARVSQLKVPAGIERLLQTRSP